MSENPIAKKPRIEYIDLAKGICITLVVMLHLSFLGGVKFSAEYYLQTFRMPLYYFLSGCFFKAYGGFWDFVKRKTNKLLIPFFFFYFFISCLTPRLVYDFWGIDWEPLEWSQFPTAFYYGKYPLGALWFLYCLFRINIVFYLIFILANKFEHSNWIVIACSAVIGAIGWTSRLMGFTIPFFGYTVFVNLPFFMFGYMLFRHTSVIKPNKYDKYLWLQVLAAIVVVVVGRLVLDQISTMYVCGFAGTYGVLMLSKQLKWLPMFSYFGRYSIMILVTHMLLCKICLEVFKPTGLSPLVVFWISLPIIMLSYYLIIPFMKKYMPHVTAQKDVIKVG